MGPCLQAARHPKQRKLSQTSLTNLVDHKRLK